MRESVRESVEFVKSWVERFALHPQALWVLFAIAFIESALIPIPPDVLLIALGLAIPRRAILFGLVTALGGFLGGYAGYLVGYTAFETVGEPVLSAIGGMSQFNAILAQYREHAILALILSGFMPIPYIVFTMAAGFNLTVDLTTLTIGTAVGRTVRFGAVGVLLYYFGPPAKLFIERHFGKITIAVAVVFVMFIILVNMLR